MANDVLITGLPRSGTTLVVSLLNRLDDVVALHEPMDFSETPLAGLRPFDEALAPYLEQTRTLILTDGRVQTRVIEGKEDDNPYGADRDDTGLRTSRARRAWANVDKALTPDFLLAIKHPMAFTAILDQIVGRLPVFAVVRNPLALLASWASVAGNFNRGRIPVAEALNPEIRQRLGELDDVVDRQLAILDWMFSQYLHHVPRRQIIVYEDLIASRGRALGVVAARASNLDVPLEPRNENPLYDKTAISRVADRLLAMPGPVWEFYSRGDVQMLAERFAHESQ